MKLRDVKKRLKMLRAWEFQCVICGHPFKDISSVSVEHLVPRSMGGSKVSANNLAPSHYSCNQLRGNKSLVTAMRLSKRQLRTLGTRLFNEWIDRRVPGRNVPREFMHIPVCRVPRCLEPPDVLPGVSPAPW